MRVLRSEVLKLTTVRTTWLLVLSMVLIEGLWAVLLTTLRSPEYLRTHDITTLFVGTSLMTVFAFTLGALMSTNEYRHRTADSTFIITPHRDRVILAKLVVGLGAGLVLALLYIAVNAGLGLSILSNRDVPVDSDIALDRYIGVGVGMVLSTVFGVGLGAALRNQVVTVTVGLAVFFVLRGFPLLLGKPSRYFPAESLAALQGIGEDFLLTQVQGGLVFGAYVVVFAIAGIVVTRTKEIS